MDNATLFAGPKFSTYINEIRRVPSDVRLKVWTSVEDDDDNKLRRHVLFWVYTGVTHTALNNCYGREPHTKICERSCDSHINTMCHYYELVKDLL